MSRLPTDQITAKTCSKCDAAFGCGMSSTSGCWCADLPHLELVGGPAGASDLDCMCPACLTEALAQSAGKEDRASYSQDQQAPAPAPLIENEDYYLEGAGLFMKTTQPKPPPLILGQDYYIEDGLLVMTAAYHKKRGTCCGNRCRWCPFEPKYDLGTTKLASDPLPPTNGETQS